MKTKIFWYGWIDNKYLKIHRLKRNWVDLRLSRFLWSRSFHGAEVFSYLKMHLIYRTFWTGDISTSTMTRKVSHP